MNDKIRATLEAWRVAAIEDGRLRAEDSRRRTFGWSLVTVVAAIFLGLFPPDQFCFTTVRGGSPGACIADNEEFFCSSWRGDLALMPAAELRGWFADTDVAAGLEKDGATGSERDRCTGHGCVPIFKQVLAGYGVTPTEEALACAVVGCPDVLGTDSQRMPRTG